MMDRYCGVFAARRQDFCPALFGNLSIEFCFRATNGRRLVFQVFQTTGQGPSTKLRDNCCTVAPNGGILE